MRTIFIAISVILPLISSVIYAKAILKNKAKPHRTTRFVIFLISTLAAISLFAQHDMVAIWLAGVSALQGFIFLILSVKFGMGGWSKTDLICLAIALSGIFLWQTTKEPILALYASIAADCIGMIPALIKTYRLPKTEIWTFYLLDVIAAFFNLLAISVWTIQAYSYPLYLVFINLIMVVLVIRPSFFNIFRKIFVIKES